MKIKKNRHQELEEYGVGDQELAPLKLKDHQEAFN
jgi:hypothetical protein